MPLDFPSKQLEEIDKIPFFKSFDLESGKLCLSGSTEIPEALYDYADHIKILQIEGGQIESLAADFARFINLEGIFMFGNQGMTKFPGVFSDMDQLNTFGFKGCDLETIDVGDLPAQTRWPIFTNNPNLKELYEALKSLEKVEKAALVNAGLTDVYLERSRQLLLLRIGVNQLEQRPEWITEHPGVAYYGEAGNPFNQADYRVAREVKRAKWENLNVDINQPALNESPASSVYIEMMDGQKVAVKLFKGKVISDGLPESDLQSALQAGSHVNLSSALAFGVDGPGQSKFIVSRFISGEQYSKVGAPPTFESCGRDFYGPEANFTADYVLNVAHASKWSDSWRSLWAQRAGKQ